MQFSGSIVAAVTPFNQGKIDIKAIQSLTDFQAKGGTSALVTCGSTGEGALLDFEEWKTVVSAYVHAAAGRFPVIAGCGAPSTDSTLKLVQMAQEMGAAAALVITPYYVKPTPAGVFTHFETLATQTTLPLIVYNNPGRAVCDLSVDTLVQLSHLPTVVGLKESHDDLSRLLELRRRIQKPFSFLSGDDPTAAAYLACGAQGVVSITANVAPRLMRDLCVAWNEGDISRFAKRRDQLDELNKALVAEPNPIPVKYALSKLGLCKNEMRLPLLPAGLKTQETLDKALSTLKLFCHEEI